MAVAGRIRGSVGGRRRGARLGSRRAGFKLQASSLKPQAWPNSSLLWLVACDLRLAARSSRSREAVQDRLPRLARDEAPGARGLRL